MGVSQNIVVEQSLGEFRLGGGGCIGILLALEGFIIDIKLAILLQLASSEWTLSKPED